MPALPLPGGITRFLPWIVLGGVVLGNLLTYGLLVGGKEEGPSLWGGPLMPGRILSLPQRPEKKVERPESGAGRFPDEPLADLIEKKRLAEKVDPLAARPTLQEGYVINAGTFVLKMGADTLFKRLQDQGLTPTMESSPQMVALNNVQAGPYAKLAVAKEAEVKLKAGGLEALVEETWEGYIISLGKFYLLGYAMQAMEQAQGLGVKPLRMVKVEVALNVHNVMLGPYASHQAAKEVSARVSNWGLAVPVIQEWSREKGVVGSSGKREQEDDGPAPKLKPGK